MPSFHIMTFGCQMNVNDSQWLAAILQKRGFYETNLKEASVIIFNTCSVREKPEQKVKNAIAAASHATKGIPDVLMVVLGCVAQQIGEKFFEIEPRLRLVAGGDNLSQIPDSIEYLLANPKEKRSLLKFCKNYSEREDADQNNLGHSAFVNIMQGCDNFCAYCIVPFTRGRQKSRQAETIITECKNYLKNGALDITLLGQNVNAWGKDLNEIKINFSDLLYQIAELPGLERLSFITSHPKDIDQATIKAFGDLPNLCPKIHLPLQAGSNRILKAMGRRYNSNDFLQIIDSLRNQRPDIAITTDLIVGFPGESEDDFQKTLEIMQKAHFMSSFSFCYSDRPGTRAALMPDKLPAKIKLERLSILQQLQTSLTTQWLTQRIGKISKVLVEMPSPRKTTEDNFWQGKDQYGVTVNINMTNSSGNKGKIVDALIVEAKKHSLLGTELTAKP